MLTWGGESLIKFESEHKCWQTKCCGGWKSCGRLSCDEIEGGRGAVCYTEKLDSEDVEMKEGDRRVECRVIN